MVVIASGCVGAVEGEEAELAPSDETESEGSGPTEAELPDGVDENTEALSLPPGWTYWWRRDAGARDAGRDSSVRDAATSDGAAADAGVADASSGTASDAARPDASAQDAGARDAAQDGGAADAARDAAVMVSDAGPTPTPGRSAGCGKSASGNDAFDNRIKRVSGVDRSYHVRVPVTYSKDRAYPVVFRFHGSGGNGLSGGLDIQYASGANAIIVAADGINAGWTGSSEANDLQLFDAMLDEVSQQYCVDPARVFAYGFSAGGGMTNAVGCKRASKIRATAAIAGFDRGDTSCDALPVAAWFQHDVTDPAVAISHGRAARDRAMRRDGCTSQSTSANGCVSYAGCKSGYPVVWCETNGLGHDIAGGTAPAKVWEFFSKLP
jgi:polyhydroxybutyrate depolymerase